MNTVSKTFTFTATPEVMKRFENFLCFFHYNGGHSGMFGMCFDGDGSDKLRCNPPPTKINRDSSLISHSVNELEIAYNDCYKSYALNRNRNQYKAKNGELTRIYSDGTQEIVQTQEP